MVLSLVNPPADIPLPTVHLLVKELKEVNDWYTFGVALDIPVRQLRIIQSSNPHAGVDRWLVDMFEYWLSSNSDASWKDIIQALEQTDQLVLAAEVKMKYLSPPAPTTTVGKLVPWIRWENVLNFFIVSFLYVEINNRHSNCYAQKKFHRYT